ncbi:MAG: hypothetical protein PW792_10935 [Acidobacteriaceae bacterium]|nr:hypothetical protein [Acidobacteriaceae bacterium]
MKRTLLSIASMVFLLASSGLACAQYGQNAPFPPPGGDWNYRNGPGQWGPDWDRRPPPHRGACFFTDAHFRGHRFCVRSGDRIPDLPGGYDHSISSIQVFGGASVQAFAGRGFRGPQAQFGMVDDLGWSSKGPRRGWNDRINSLIVN